MSDNFTKTAYDYISFLPWYIWGSYQHLILSKNFSITFHTVSLGILEVSSQTNLNQDFTNSILWFWSFYTWLDETLLYVGFGYEKQHFVKITLVVIPMESISIFEKLKGGLVIINHYKLKWPIFLGNMIISTVINHHNFSIRKDDELEGSY